ncbi:hypothetical protein AO275_09150 [Pseudomonas viridiflava]|nr:hypothetical protein AO275_09150 [Pseudomonas viridiflava]
MKIAVVIHIQNSIRYYVFIAIIELIMEWFKRGRDNFTITPDTVIPTITTKVFFMRSVGKTSEI